MRVIICIKQIPDPRNAVFDLQKGKITVINRIINPADVHALEEGLRIKETHGAELIVLSLGPEECDAALTHALTRGVDSAIRVWNDSVDPADTWAISCLIHTIVKSIGFDLILCGNASEDTSSEFVWAALSELLNVPMVTRVVGLELSGKNDGIAHKKLEKGRRETYSFKLPAVIGVVEGINHPRYSALFSRAYQEGIRKKIEVMDPGPPLPTAAPMVSLVRVTQPKPRTRTGKKLTGLSVAAMMRVLKGETGGQKEIFSGPAAKGAEKIAVKLMEWIRQP
ncbi:MAG: hypothetical protein V2B19_19265 [Pseudomonadota bacterium]